MKSMFILVLSLLSFTASSNTLADYCANSGGKVEKMTAQFQTHSGLVAGQSENFCNFFLKDAFVAIGLKSFASSEPSLAATYMKMLPEIGPFSPLLKGKYSIKALNLCVNLGGAEIVFVTAGGFSGQLGQTDVCVFGDGSMVSAWSLYYMANHRLGYNPIKEKVLASPLDIDLPTT